MSDERKKADAGRVEKLLRGERAAVESYERAIRDLGRTNGVLVEEMRTLLGEHRRALEILESHTARSGGDPDQDAGGWGAFAKLVEKAGAALGERALLEAMKQGETHGLSEYRTALDADDTPGALRTDIRETLIPAQRRHVAILDELMAEG